MKSTHPRRRLLAGGVAALLAVVPAACGGDDDDASPATQAPSGATAAPTEPTEPSATTPADEPGTSEPGTTEPATDEPATSEPASPDTVVPDSGSDCVAPGSYDSDGTFTFAYTTDTRSFDPDQIGAASDLIFLFPLYDTLLYETPQGDLQGLLAESWEVAPDGSSVTLTLRSGLTFHDGTPLDAAAVVANIERARTFEGGFNQAALANVESVEATGDLEVVITVSGGITSLLTSLAGAAGMMVSPAAFDLDHIEMAKVGGSGAFDLTNFQSGVEARYTKVADYWDTEAYGFAELVIPIIGDNNARVNALLTGDIDATLGGGSLNDTAADAGLAVCTGESVSGITLTFNTARAEFGDVRVRQAINYAIDREAITDVIFKGLCVANSQRFPSWFYAGNPDIPADHYNYDPDKARDLLAEAGIDGFTFEVHTPSDVGTYPALAEVLQQYLADVGITVEIVPSEIHTILEAFRTDKSADAHLAPLVTTEPGSYLASFYLADGINNPGGYEAPGMRELFDQLAAATTLDEQRPIFAEIAQLATDEAYPQLVFCNSVQSYVAGNHVGGLQIYYNNVRNFRTVTVD